MGECPGLGVAPAAIGCRDSLFTSWGLVVFQFANQIEPSVGPNSSKQLKRIQSSRSISNLDDVDGAAVGDLLAGRDRLECLALDDDGDAVRQWVEG